MLKDPDLVEIHPRLSLRRSVPTEVAIYVMPDLIQAAPGVSKRYWFGISRGLVGTGLLAWSTWRAVQLARDRNGVMSRLLELEVVKAETSAAVAKGATDSDARLAALDASQTAFLKARQTDLDAAHQQWTPWDTRRTVAGVFLTILSYGTPAVAYLPRLCGGG